MKTKIARWGNSLALRIPSRLAQSHHLQEGTDVEILEEAGELKVRPIQPDKLDLGQLLAGITRKNLHGEEDSGNPAGKELW